MKARFSEFSFGFAITSELIEWHGSNLTAAPYFPSLNQEGGATGRGYDVRLNRPGIPLFLQFKLSEYIHPNSSSVEKKTGVFGDPFYRMHIWSRKKSYQHDLLCDLDANGNEVFYVAPVFWEERRFNELYVTKGVCNRSVFVKPLTIGRMPDDNEHHISFQDTVGGYRFSEPVKLDGTFSMEDFQRSLTVKLRELPPEGFSWNQALRDFEAQVKSISSSVIQETLDDLPETRHPLERIAFMSQMLGLQLYVATFKEQ